MCKNMLLESCLDVLFPPRCTMCDLYLSRRGGSRICLECWEHVRWIEEPVCSICGMELYAQGDINPICGECLLHTPPFAFARALFYYNDEIRGLVSRLKYKKDTSVLPAIDELVKKCDLRPYRDCDYVIPVPLHKKRLQKRGFNQALLLAKIFFSGSDVRIRSTLLRRTRNTVPQVSLDGKARRKSLKNAFTVDSGIELSGATVCLVDDVYTTGTTVSECSRELLLNGAKKIIVLTLARVDAPYRGRSFK